MGVPFYRAVATGGCNGLFKVGNDIFRRFEPHGKTHQPIRDPQPPPQLRLKIRMGG